jgi:hypothetical protein
MVIWGVLPSKQTVDIQLIQPASMGIKSAEGDEVIAILEHH